MAIDPGHSGGMNRGASTGGAGTSSLSTDRLQEIQLRLATGFYDEPQVIAHIARRISLELYA